jgi:O-antigen/teichoic acid export membrane protein
MPGVSVASALGPRFLQDVSVTFGSRVLGLVIALLASIVAARFLGPGGKGVLAVVGLLSSVAVQVGDLGMHASTAYFSARDPKALPRIAGLCLWLAALMGILLSFLILGVAWLFPHSLNEVPSQFLLFALALTPFGLVSLYFQNILLGMQRILAFNLVDLGGKGAGLVAAIIILWGLGLGVWELLLAGLAISAGSSFVTVCLALRGSRLVLAIDRGLAGQMLRYGVTIYLACLFAYLVIRIDLLLVNYFSGVTEAGIYSVSVSFADLLCMLPISIGTVLFPRVACAQGRDGEMTLKVCRHSVVLIAGVCLLTALLARPLILFLFGGAFAGATLPLLWLLPGIFLLSLESILANDLAGRGYPRVLVAYWFLGLLVNVGVNLLAIPRWGATGAAASSTVTYGLMFVLVFRCFLTESGSSWHRALLLQPTELQALYRSVRRLLAFKEAR